MTGPKEKALEILAGHFDYAKKLISENDALNLEGMIKYISDFIYVFDRIELFNETEKKQIHLEYHYLRDELKKLLKS